jgi:hypothetical protein
MHWNDDTTIGRRIDQDKVRAVLAVYEPAPALQETDDPFRGDGHG